jgi:hypothetical protein
VQPVRPVSLVPLRALKHPSDTPVWKLEAACIASPAAKAGTTAVGSGRNTALAGKRSIRFRAVLRKLVAA